MNPRNNLAVLFALLSCFLKHTNAQNRIISGRNINIRESPHSIAIFYARNYICAGTLVNANSVVTATHCVYRVEQNMLRLKAGVTDVRRISEEQCHTVQSIHHNGVDPETRDMSVAVVKVAGIFLEDNIKVKSILLCEAPLLPHSTFEISGWGSAGVEDADPFYRLKKTNVRVKSPEECRAEHAIVQTPMYLSDSIICGCGRDLGFHDSGAGGIVEGRLCAVAQFRCGNENLPDLYTNITIDRVQSFIRSYL